MNIQNRKYEWCKFSFASYRTDYELRRCSDAARLLWWDVLALMATGSEVGYLTLSGRPWTLAELAAECGKRPARIKSLLAELMEKNIFSIRPKDGALYSRRMVREHAERERAYRNGKMGGNPALLAARGAANECAHNEPTSHIFPPSHPPRETPRNGPYLPPMNQQGLTPPLTQKRKEKEVQLKDSEEREEAKKTQRASSFIAAHSPIRGEGHSSHHSQASALALPEWLPQEPWKNYIAMRKTIKKPATLSMQRQIIKTLEQYKEEGYDITAILRQSTARHWVGLYTPKDCTMNENSDISARPIKGRRVQNQYQVLDDMAREWGLAELDISSAPSSVLTSASSVVEGTKTPFGGAPMLPETPSPPAQKGLFVVKNLTHG